MTDQLDNKLLQKIIHAPSLWDNDFPKFHDTFCIPKGMIDNQKYHNEISDIRHSKSLHNRYRKELINISVGVQQSAKFKFNNNVCKSIEEDDFKTVSTSINTYLPFKNVYLEVRDDEASLTTSYLITEVTEHISEVKVPKKNFFGRTKWVPLKNTDDTIFVAVSCFFVADIKPEEVAVVPAPMILPVSNTTELPTYSFSDDSFFTPYFVNDSDGLSGIAWVIVNNIRWLQVLLSYPSLANTNSVSGRKPIPYNKLGKFKASSMYSLPKWEHKVLEVDMYSNGSSGGGNGSARGKRFHAVRKHLRRLPSGKSVFVKPHFRGDKKLGVIDKDYLIKGDK
tara:strand:- start:1397 stop:2407 length:1011 start_codon:yes stop_codon:yes gene_type:complete